MSKRRSSKQASKDSTTGSKWEQPQEVDWITVAFPANVCGTLLPGMDEIPDEFKRHSNPWCELVSELFFNGGSLPAVKTGIDATAASRHLRAVLGSWEPKHEHKTAGAAYLMSLWYQAN